MALIQTRFTFLFQFICIVLFKYRLNPECFKQQIQNIKSKEKKPILLQREQRFIIGSNFYNF